MTGHKKILYKFRKKWYTHYKTSYSKFIQVSQYDWSQKIYTNFGKNGIHTIKHLTQIYPSKSASNLLFN